MAREDSSDFRALPAERATMEIRRPTQKRGRLKFEAILDCAEQLLLSRDPNEIGVYDIASALSTTPQTVYHFFPEASLIFVALAERYLARLQEMPTPSSPPGTNWPELLDLFTSRTLNILRSSDAVPKVLLGVGYSTEIRKRDMENNRVMADRILEMFKATYVMPAVPELLDRFVEMVAISDAIWTLYVCRDGSITEAAERLASRARTSYLRTVLPEFLTPRHSNVKPQVVSTCELKNARDSKQA